MLNVKLFSTYILPFFLFPRGHSVTNTIESSKNGTTTLSRMHLSGYVGRATNSLVKCLLLRAFSMIQVRIRVRIRFGI